MKEKIAKLGKPSLVFGPGQKRRLNLVKKYVDLSGKRILDIGCGIGTYTKKFSQESQEVFGVDIDAESLKKAKKLNPDINFLLAPAEKLPFKDNFFDVVFLHEVLEHVKDDKQAISETFRVLKPNGVAVIFVPNRLYPFETHGIYLFGHYIYKLVPFVNWLPKNIRRYFCPHVRIYSVGDLKKLFNNLRVSFLVISYIYPALDKLAGRSATLAKILRRLFNIAENNRLLKRFGISIFAVVKKNTEYYPKQ